MCRSITVGRLARPFESVIMEKEFIRQTARRYKKYTLWMIVGLFLVILFACRVSKSCDDIIAQVVNPLAVSAIFSLIASTAYGEAWQAIAKSSPANLAKFYLAASALKMMAAAVVFLIYVLVSAKTYVLGFTLIFALYYVVLLVFDCLYFSRVEKKARIS